MSPRSLEDWITYYLKFTENTEPPKAYHLWTAISVIAGALQRRVYAKWGHETIYPNLYIVLVGPSGRTRKGVAMSIGIEIFSKLNFPTTAESVTREQLIRSMKGAVASYEDVGKIPPIKFHSSMTTFSRELAVFLGQRDLRFLADLTDWYDSHDSWRYETKTAGWDHIKGLCHNLLGATAPDWLQSMIPLEAVGGGFTARIIFISEETRKTIPRPLVDEGLRGPLVKDLQRVGTLCGEYRIEEEAWEAYIDWYEREEAKIQRGESPVPDPRFASYCERRPTHVKKLAMILAASRSHETIIQKRDIERAIAVLESAEVRMATVFGGLGRSRIGELAYLILQFLQRNGGSTRTEIMRRFYTELNTLELEEVERVLTYMKVIDIELLPKSGEKIYKLIGQNQPTILSNSERKLES